MPERQRATLDHMTRRPFIVPGPAGELVEVELAASVPTWDTMKLGEVREVGRAREPVAVSTDCQVTYIKRAIKSIRRSA